LHLSIKPETDVAPAAFNTAAFAAGARTSESAAATTAAFLREFFIYTSRFNSSSFEHEKHIKEW
jgi:hypothetical protein